MITRKFHPGSEWLYFKVYTGIKTSDTILQEVIEPLVEQLQIQNLIDQWFFIRYNDPKPHLRIRLNLKNITPYSIILGMINSLFKDYLELKAELLTSSCFINDGKGGFTRQDLPDAVQAAPIFSFAGLGNGNWLAGGNFYGTIPYEGQYDALFPTVLSYRSDRKWSTGPMLSSLSGEVRDLKWIRSSGEDILTVARNNDSLRFLQNVQQEKK